MSERRDPAARRQRNARLLAGALAIACIATAAAAWWALRASLPRSTGAVTIAALYAPVTVELDAAAVPRIRAQTLGDALLAQGFLHAQQRFFQMDLARRAAAGELAELVGEAALELDRAQRRYRMRERARRLLEQLPAQQRAWLEAYTLGVNAGLADLDARPPEYWLLRSRPARWQVDDSVLVAYSVYTTLSMNHVYEQPQAVMRAVLPDELYRFLTPSSSRFDHLLVPLADGSRSDHEPIPVPPASVIDVRALPSPDLQPPLVAPPLTGPAASNQWAVGAMRSATGRAMLANDPHLGLQLPGVFYRSELGWPGASASGIGIPGVPGILIGASDALAWGATASNADQSDWVVVEVDPGDSSRYRVPGGTEAFDTVIEEIRVRDGTTVQLEIRETRWGPVTDQDWLGRPLALRATWLDPDGLNFDLLELPLAGDIDRGIEALGRWAGPALNWMLADSGGRIGWTVNGPLPERAGFDGSVPQSWASGQRSWNGLLEPPALSEGRGGVLLSANNRTLPREDSDRLSRLWMRPFRARRIAELLDARSRFTERDFLDMQLDTRAEAYDRFRDLLLEAVPADDNDAGLRAARAEVERWNGHADTDQAGFRLLHLFYRALLERVLTPLLLPARQADPGFSYRWPLADETLRRVLDEQPEHLLPADFADWPSFLRTAFSNALEQALAVPAAAPIDAPWGDVNRVAAGHPLRGLPMAGRWLTLRAQPQPGSMVSLRVASPIYGAAARLVVAPADPAAGILQTPGGQSGHFLSRHFMDLHADWADGEPTPFTPGALVSQFELRPAQ